MTSPSCVQALQRRVALSLGGAEAVAARGAALGPGELHGLLGRLPARRAMGRWLLVESGDFEGWDSAGEW